MKNEEYQRLHDLPKELDDYNINMAAQFTQVSMSGHGKFNTKEKFTVIQNRKGHHRVNNLTYILRSSKGTLIRVDINGKTHCHISTPHVHIFDEAHNNGIDAFPLSELKNYPYLSDDVLKSLKAFLVYNNFEIKELTISNNLV
ncbi:hypothetical protein LMB33_04210 [Limosilactobacillus reuteri]|uniref:DUF6978 family protein n=1 Tax=Limosilactobacillus reuteri TaxID=1598 RepID=UPI001E340F08|nr:hypothetical protein [Limosilactobacillus reuteri]MCC4325636.1 hypothetical protein [Limosilactobacillus reuteri]MCC4329581.1 hypothetical protein [Limosilactobacillus reuteri]MCC4351217.1 hypothetical protein [Limosilactobacillus reuteri]MCC4376346.1 hypothetical protein [Limosilactobacillus reuteri]